LLFKYGVHVAAAEMVVVAAETWQQWLLQQLPLLFNWGRAATAATAIKISAAVTTLSAFATVSADATIAITATLVSFSLLN
jgi:hypothetical protein